jgi:hypothetical protein
MLCMLMMVFLFIARLTLSFIIMRHTLSFIMRLTVSFIIMRFTLSFIIMCSCFMLCNSNSILLSFANHAFFKYNKPINMNFHHHSLQNLNPNRSTYSDILNNSTHFLHASFHNIIDIST